MWLHVVLAAPTGYFGFVVEGAERSAQAVITCSGLITQFLTGTERTPCTILPRDMVQLGGELVLAFPTVELELLVACHRDLMWLHVVLGAPTGYFGFVVEGGERPGQAVVTCSGLVT